MTLTHTQAQLLTELSVHGPAGYRVISYTLPVQSARSVKRLVTSLLDQGYVQYGHRAYKITVAGEAALADRQERAAG